MSAPEGLDLSAAQEALEDGDGLVLDLEGYEGPLHVLLTLAQTKKIDLARLSIAALADQYLAFIDAARAARIELAGDYLVMAAWLALLKSRLLLPRTEPAEADALDPDTLAGALAAKLQRLAQARAAARVLDALPQLGRDVHVQGQPREIEISRRSLWRDDLYDLLKAYGGNVSRRVKRTRYAAKPRKAYSLEAARKRLEGLARDLSEWRPIDALAPAPADMGGVDAPAGSPLASTFGAALELVRDGSLEARQHAPFAPLYLRARREDRG